MVIPKLYCYVSKDDSVFQIVFSQSSAINQHNKFPLATPSSHVIPLLVWAVG